MLHRVVWQTVADFSRSALSPSSRIINTWTARPWRWSQLAPPKLI